MTQDHSGRKKLSELRVVDLRNELEKRSLNTTGVKSALLDRLQTALRDEGLDPETHEFEVSSTMDGAAVPLKSRKTGLREEPTEDAEEHLDSSDSPPQENIPLAKEDPDDETQQPEEAGLEVHAEENNEFDENEDSKVPEGDEKDEADEKLDGDGEQRGSKGPGESPDCCLPGDKKDDEKENDAEEAKPVESVNVWISCLPHSTKAAELKKLCSKCGKISSAKIVTNAKSPKSGCYGYVTMSTLEDAKKCVAELNESEYNGHKLAVEMTDLDPAGALRASASRKKAAAKKESEQQKEQQKEQQQQQQKEQQQQQLQSPKKKVISLKRDLKEKKKEEGDEVIQVDLELEGKGEDKTKLRRERSRERSDVRKRLGARIPTSTSTSKLRGRTGRIVSRRGGRGSFRGSRPGGERMAPPRGSATFRDRHDSRERKRELERRQRDEMYRLEREREKIRLEREKLAQEKLELLKIERDRQRAERARIQHEREVLLRRKLDVTRQPKRSYDDSRSTSSSDYYRKKEFDHRRRDDSTSVVSKRPREDYSRGSSSYASSSREVSRSSYGSSAGSRNNGYSGDCHSTHHNHHSSSHHSASGGASSHSRGDYSSNSRDTSSSYKWTNPKWSSSAHQGDYQYSSSASNYGTVSRGYGSTSSSSSRRY